MLILQNKMTNAELTGLVNEELTFRAALPVRSIIMIFLLWRRSVKPKWRSTTSQSVRSQISLGFYSGPVFIRLTALGAY